MKHIKNKYILSTALAAFFLVFAPKMDAQKAEFGLRYMPTFSSFDINTSSGGTIKGEATLGHGFGVLLGFSITKFVGVQGEVIYSSYAQRYKETDNERKINLEYVNIPLMLSLNTGKTKAVNLNVVVGPQIGISVGSRYKTIRGIDDPNGILSVKKGDLGFAYGAGLDFGINAARNVRFGLGYRGVYGLFDISDDSRTTSGDNYLVIDKTNVKTNAAYIGISFLF